jgi:F0F1-type ATP synthase membrane subunit b/b'
VTQTAAGRILARARSRLRAADRSVSTLQASIRNGVFAAVETAAEAKTLLAAQESERAEAQRLVTELEALPRWELEKMVDDKSASDRAVSEAMNVNDD